MSRSLGSALLLFSAVLISVGSFERALAAPISWSPPVAVNQYATTDTPSIQYDMEPTCHLSNAGTANVIWRRYENNGKGLGIYSLQAARSTDAGATWQPQQTILPPSAAPASYSNRLMVTNQQGLWVNLLGDSKSWNIATSVDDGVNWKMFCSSDYDPPRFDVQIGTGNTAVILQTHANRTLWESWVWPDGFPSQSVGRPEILRFNGTEWGRKPLIYNQPSDLYCLASVAIDSSGRGIAPVFQAGYEWKTWTYPDLTSACGVVFTSDWNLCMAQTTDGGATWSTPKPLHISTGPVMNAGGQAVTDNDNRWVIAYVTSGTLTFSTSTDAGDTWTTAARIPALGQSSYHIWEEVQSLKYVGADRWECTTQYAHKVWLMYSLDFGQTWSERKEIVLQPPNEASLGSNRLNVWSEDNGVDSDIIGNCSHDGGATWSAPEPVNGDATTDQQLLTIQDHACDALSNGAGNWLVAMSSSFYSSGVESGDGFFLTESTGNGVSWGPELPLMPSCSSFYRIYGFATGDYLGIRMRKEGSSYPCDAYRMNCKGVPTSAPTPIAGSAPWTATDNVAVAVSMESQSTVDLDSTWKQRRIARTSYDQGVHWSEPIEMTPWQVTSAADSVGLQYAGHHTFLASSDNGELLRSLDDGITWHSAGPQPYQRVGCDQRGHCIGLSISDTTMTVAHSYDAGATWAHEYSADPGLRGSLVRSLDTDGRGNWVAVVFTSTGTSLVYSADDGQNWMPGGTAFGILRGSERGDWIQVWDASGVTGYDADVFASTATLASALPLADLRAKFSGETLAAVPGQEFSAHISVSNSGPAKASEVRLRGVLPDGLRLIGADTSQGTAQTSGSIVSAELGDIAAGSSVELLLALAGTTAASFETSVVVVTSAPDADYDDNVTSTSVHIGDPAADLSGTLSPPRVGVTRRNNISVRTTLHVDNTGNATSRRTHAQAYICDATCDITKGTPVQTLTLPPIRPGKSRTVQLKTNVTGTMTAGSKYLVVILDPENIVEEISKSNNRVSLELPAITSH